MSYINKISVKGNIYNVNDAEARFSIEDLRTRIAAIESALGGGTATSGSLPYVYYDVPNSDEVESSDFLLIEIDFADNANFENCVSFGLSDCTAFNPAEGVWVTPPAEGLGIAFCGSKIRLATPEGDYTLCRYRWKYADDAYVKSSYKVAII